jgi:uncharacterized protein YjbI with pentapeptide repeats
MPKDPLLSEEFFSPSSLSASELSLAQHESDDFDQLIKQRIYPHLSDEQTPTYYQGAHTLSDLYQFVYPEGIENLLHSDNFRALQEELKLTVEKIQSWVEANNIEGGASLTGFLTKLAQPSDSMSLLYGDGKKLLEKVAILLDNSLISIENRQQTALNLLAHNELEKCIAGCYSRIASAALQLQEGLDSNQQINYWLRSYAKLMASQVAAQRPFAMPDTYQVLLCKAGDSSAEQNMLHAHNYLLMQAKEHGFPLEIERDLGAIELGNRLTPLSKTIIINAYINALEQQISAKNLVAYLSEKLHESFSLVMSSDSDYADKTTIILNKLNLLGADPWFNTNQVGLDEILTESGALRGVESLKITVTERLISRKLLTTYERIKKILLFGGQQFQYREFPAAVELTWFEIDSERKPLLQILGDCLPFLLIHTFIKDTQSLLAVLKKLSSHEDFKDFLHALSAKMMARFIKQSDSVQLFSELLSYIPDRAKRALFLQECGDDFIRKMLKAGLDKVDVRSQFPGLPFGYLIRDYDDSAKREGRSVTKELIKRLIDSGFKNFKDISFKQLSHLNYLDGINFSKANLQYAYFLQSVCHCNFAEAELKGARFFADLENLSFRRADLREVFFQNDRHYSAIDLEDALLSTQSFRDLRLSYVTSFRGANLKEVDFQESIIKNNLKFLDFSKANLESANLSQLKLNGLMLRDANLAEANLHSSEVTLVIINDRTNLQASQLDLSFVDYSYKKGFKNFDSCKIYLDMYFLEYEFPAFSFYRASFKGAEFIGEHLAVDFIECDLRSSLFNPKITLNSPKESHLKLNINSKKSQWEGALFRQVKFIGDTQFTDSVLTQLKFEQVEMQASALFAFYQAGHRDFKGVKDLKGSIPKKLLAFPVLDAELNKQTFLHLYRQGLRDFRGSNLNSFYLGQLLTEQAITDIDLKLEGAKYEQSAFGCASSSQHSPGHSPRHKRSSSTLATMPPCAVHFLFQRREANKKKLITREDIELFAQAGQERFVVKEVVLGSRALFLLTDVNVINFYWSNQPDETIFIRSYEFTRDSTRPSDRSTISLRFYFFKRFNNPAIFSIFAGNLGSMGFTDVRLNYYSRQTQLLAIQLRNGMISVVPGQQILGKKFHAALLDEVKDHPINVYKKGEYRARLRHIGLEVKRKIGQGFRVAGRSGGYYEVGAALMFLFSQWLSNRNVEEPKKLDRSSKAALKDLAWNVTQEVGEEVGASERQMQRVWEVAEQCIDRGECANEESVMRDIQDSLQRMRTDTQIATEYAWEKTKEIFSNVGSYVSDKFDDLKKFFTSVNNRSNKHLFFPVVMGGNLISTYRIHEIGRKHKRKLYAWYESPVLMRLMKDIELGFAALDYDMQLNDNFSEELLAGFLSEIWEVLAQSGVNKHSSPAFILNLLENTRFIEQAFNMSLEEPLLTEWELAPPLTELPLNISAVTQSPPREKRSIKNHHYKKMDEIEEQADKFLMRSERQSVKQARKSHAIKSDYQKVAHVKKSHVIKFKHPKVEPVRKNHVIQSGYQRVDPARNSHAIKFDQRIKQAKKSHASIQKNKSQEYVVATQRISPLKQSAYFKQERKEQRQLGQENFPKALTEKDSFHSRQPGKSKVINSVKVQETLFACNFIIRLTTGVTYDSPSAEKAIRRQRAEKQIQKIKGKVIR